MKEDLITGLVYSGDATQTLKLAREYKKILESGITYEQLVDLYLLDKQIYLEKELKLTESSLVSSNNLHDEPETNIKSYADAKRKELALRLSYELLYENK